MDASGVDMGKSQRLMVAGGVIWAVLASLVYFNGVGAGHDCYSPSFWIVAWNFLTFGQLDLFPYEVGVSSPDVGALIRGEVENYCSHTYYFSPLGYALFLVLPVVIVVACYSLYRWTVGSRSE